MVDTLTCQTSGESDSSAHGRWKFGALMGWQIAVYGCVALLSRRFEFTSNLQQRPILLVLYLLAIAFGLHLLSLRAALRSPNQVSVARVILLGAVLYRAILLPSPAIQEVDLYRYLWDGAVVANGGNPWHFSPEQILTASHINDGSSSLNALIDLQKRMRAGEEILRRIHYGELITVYPPVSQVVFGLASFTVPNHASLDQHVFTMKTVLVLFDLITVWLLLAILQRVGRHAGWAILYAWSPLVLKEFANSGHLDSIAVCLTTGSVLCLLGGPGALKARSADSRWMLSAVLLGLGVGAKLYPLVLIPVLAFWALKRVGRLAGILYFLITLSCSAASLAPMLLTRPVTTELEQRPSPELPNLAATVTAGSGLATFLSRWEINDLLFLVIVENLRPDVTHTPPHGFVITPDSFRLTTAEFLSTTLKRPIPEATFLTARLVTLLIFLAIVAGVLWRAVYRNETEVWLRTVFLTLAWFWALAPTLNPWYWTWAIPFLPFAGRRAWTAVSLLVLVYYLRFWLLYQFPDSEILGTRYRGEKFFHFVVAPFEHAVWLIWLTAESLILRGVCPRSQTVTSPSE